MSSAERRAALAAPQYRAFSYLAPPTIASLKPTQKLRHLAGDTVPNLPAPRTFRARVAEALRRLSARTSPTAPASASASKGKLLSVGASEWLRDEALRARAERHKVS